MRLLFDQNISFRVAKKLAHIYPHAKQIRELGLEGASDRAIWQYAKDNAFTIVTYDADFYDLVTLYGHPPKLIWLRFGNTRTQTIVDIFEAQITLIRDFIEEISYSGVACLEIEK